MRADTRTISIERGAPDLFRFVADPENLPRWAIGFARAVRREGDGWVVTTGGGADVAVRVLADAASGVVDFVLVPAPGVEHVASSRVLARGAASEYVFTQLQPPGMPDEAFEKSVAALAQELAVLKAVLEVECPA